MAVGVNPDDLVTRPSSNSVSCCQWSLQHGSDKAGTRKVTVPHQVQAAPTHHRLEKSTDPHLEPLAGPYHVTFGFGVSLRERERQFVP